MKEYTCVICNKKFESDYLRLCCGKECDYIKNEQLRQRRNERKRKPNVEYHRKCLVCGTPYVASGRNAKNMIYCSPRCGNKACRDRNKERIKHQKRMKARKGNKDIVSLAEMARRANEAGMTYGQYMVKVAGHE